MKHPPMPSFLLSEDCPSEAELNGIIKLKRNGAAPGLDGILYVPFKRCPCLVKLLVKIFQESLENEKCPRRVVHGINSAAGKIGKPH